MKRPLTVTCHPEQAASPSVRRFHAYMGYYNTIDWLHEAIRGVYGGTPPPSSEEVAGVVRNQLLVQDELTTRELWKLYLAAARVEEVRETLKQTGVG